VPFSGAVQIAFRIVFLLVVNLSEHYLVISAERRRVYVIGNINDAVTDTRGAQAEEKLWLNIK
jgi:hypothetical protein